MIKAQTRQLKKIRRILKFKKIRRKIKTLLQTWSSTNLCSKRLKNCIWLMSRNIIKTKKLRIRTLNTISLWSRKVPFRIKSQLWKCWSKKDLIGLFAIYKNFWAFQGNTTKSKQRLRFGRWEICSWITSFRMEKSWPRFNTIQAYTVKIRTLTSMRLSWLTRITTIVSKSSTVIMWLQSWQSSRKTP